jgi:hypothetical protein
MSNGSAGASTPIVFFRRSATSKIRRIFRLGRIVAEGDALVFDELTRCCGDSDLKGRKGH